MSDAPHPTLHLSSKTFNTNYYNHQPFHYTHIILSKKNLQPSNLNLHPKITLYPNQNTKLYL